MPYREGRIVSFFRASEMYFSYGQFFIYDTGLYNPACDWTDEHFRQGFARRHRAVVVRTLSSYGNADMTLYLGPPSSLERFERVIAIPLEIESGSISVDCVAESSGVRNCPVPNGSYRVVVAQRYVGWDHDEEDGDEEVHIYLEQLDAPLTRSEILVKDAALDPPDVLVEDAKKPKLYTLPESWEEALLGFLGDKQPSVRSRWKEEIDFEALTEQEAQQLLAGYLRTGQEAVHALSPLMEADGVLADFSMASVPGVIKWALSRLRDENRPPNESGPKLIDEPESCSRGTAGLEPEGKDLLLRVSFYLGEAFVRRYPGLAWGLGEPGRAYCNMPVVAGFQNGKKLAPVVAVYNLFDGILRRGDPVEAVDGAVMGWQERVGGGPRLWMHPRE